MVKSDARPCPTTAGPHLQAVPVDVVLTEASHRGRGDPEGAEPTPDLRRGRV